MVELGALYRALESFRPRPDAQQRRAIEQPADAAVFIVAGPGSGKTTCLTLRILKLVLVDGIPPRGILATTFTVKAAQELHSRVLGWGFRIIDALKEDSRVPGKAKTELKDLDINQVWTGTLDSLCEQVLRDFRAPATQPPILVDEFVAGTLLLRHGLFNGRRDQDPDLSRYLLSMYSDSNDSFGFNVGAKVGLLQSFWDRCFHDQVAWNTFVAKGKKETSAGRTCLDAALSDYAAELEKRGMVDFPLLENEVLARLRRGQLDEFTRDLRVVLVDEYQDTNLLQEQIYFHLGIACGGALTVVGDDDQSLYRFRGATIDLFSNFLRRHEDFLKKRAQDVYLSVNYRSTQRIVGFVNEFAKLDSDFQSVRVSGKPQLKWGPRAVPGRPILGMFRETREDLAAALASFIHDVFRGRGFSTRGIERIICDPDGGDVGDCALLCSSPAEFSAGGEARLPLLLRQALASKTPAVEVFNPRGEDLSGVDLVARLGGLIAECIDPNTESQGKTSGLSNEAIRTLNLWRQTAIRFATSNRAPRGLLSYVQGWMSRDPDRPGFVWPRSVAAIELIYGLVHFLPELHDDAEGQVYLEVFTRQLGACEQIGGFRGRLINDAAKIELTEASVRGLLRDFLGPIASGMIQVDETLIEAFPRDRLSVLSIHQSKGLEFPIAIVDVGCDFKRDHPAHAFKRYPSAGSAPHRLEDELRIWSPLGPVSRSQVDRAFDDLIRQFFVAFSRAQEVLLLVGIRPSHANGSVPNVATGWDRRGICHWRGTEMPFVEI
jgi:DNA helicase-2/ATP-dependent DNA helicase PcrA